MVSFALEIPKVPQELFQSVLSVRITLVLSLHQRARLTSERSTITFSSRIFRMNGKRPTWRKPSKFSVTLPQFLQRSTTMVFTLSFATAVQNQLTASMDPDVPPKQSKKWTTKKLMAKFFMLNLPLKRASERRNSNTRPLNIRTQRRDATCMSRTSFLRQLKKTSETSSRTTVRLSPSNFLDRKITRAPSLSSASRLLILQAK